MPLGLRAERRAGRGWKNSQPPAPQRSWRGLRGTGARPWQSKVREKAGQVSGDGNTKSPAPVQVGYANESGCPARRGRKSSHSSVRFWWDWNRGLSAAEFCSKSGRRGTLQLQRAEARSKGAGMPGATRIATPPRESSEASNRALIGSQASRSIGSNFLL